MNQFVRPLVIPFVLGLGLISACSASEDSQVATEALTAAYEECTGYTVVLADGEFEAPDGDSGVGDDGRTVWVDQGGGQCVADRLSWPTRIEKAVRMGSSGADSWDGYNVTWNWEDPMGAGLSMIVSTDSGALPAAADDDDGESALENACLELGNGNLSAAAANADRSPSSEAESDLAEHLRELSMLWDWYSSGPAPALSRGIITGTRDELIAHVLEQRLAPAWDVCDDYVDDDARYDRELMAADFTTIAGTAWDRQGRPPLDANLEGGFRSKLDPGPTDVDGWIRALASNDPRAITRALDMTEPGSPAESYVLYRSIVTEHVTNPPDKVHPLDDGYELCARDGACIRITDIEQRDGLVNSFTIDAAPVDQFVVGRASSTLDVRDTAVVHRVLAYQSPLSGSLWLVIRLENVDLRADLEISRFKSSYTGAGDARRAGSVFGPKAVPPGGGGYYVVQFPEAELGGTATVAVLKTNGAGWTVDLEVPSAI